MRLTQALQDALSPLASSMRARAAGLPAGRAGGDADPLGEALSLLATWKVVDTEVKRLTANAAAHAGSCGASYEQLGAAWGITRQGARKKWPDTVSRSAPSTASMMFLEMFGGTAELLQLSSGGWGWTAKGADGAGGAADEETSCPSKEEAAAHAGAFLKEHAADGVDQTC